MRFLLFLLAVATFCVGLHLTLLYGPISFGQFRLLLHSANQQSALAHIPQLALTPARYAALRGAAGLGLLLGAAGSWYLGRKGIARQLLAETAAACRAVGAGWGSLSRAERGVAVALLLGIAGTRTWFLVCYPFSADEAATYDYFVRCGPRVAAAFYALPNNHILYSLLSWPLVRGLGSWASPDLLVRLPGFSLGLVTTALAYACLARLTSLRVATLATGLFQLSPMVVQYAVAARGYGLQAAGVQALFLAAMVLWRERGYHQLGYAVFVGASLWGFYLIPTFAYPFLSLSGTLLVVFVVGGRRQDIRYLVAATLGVAVLVGFLYLPVGLVSGWASLMQNPYVMALSAAQFWSRFASYYLWGTIAELWGRPELSLPVLLVVVVGSLLLRTELTASMRQAAGLALFGLLTPWLLLMLQHVYAPARTLHYLLFYAALAAALFLEALLKRLRVHPAITWFAVVTVISAYASYRLRREALVMEPGQRQMALSQRHSGWLTARHAQWVLADVNLRGQYFLFHYAFRSSHPLKGVASYHASAPDAGYDYLLLGRATNLPQWAVSRRAKLEIEDEDSRLYYLPPPFTLRN